MLTEKTVKDFIEVLASNAPAPGGGSAAALSGAMGAALVAMVCRLTIGKAGYEQHDALMHEVLGKATAAQNFLTEAVQKDTDAFEAVMAAFAMPKSSDNEKSARSAAIQSAFKGAVASPEKVAVACFVVLELMDSILDKCNTNAISDIGVALGLLVTGVDGAILNVKINLPSIKDIAYVEEKKKFASDISTKAGDLALTMERAFYKI